LKTQPKLTDQRRPLPAGLRRRSSPAPERRCPRASTNSSTQCPRIARTRCGSDSLSAASDQVLS